MSIQFTDNINLFNGPTQISATSAGVDVSKRQQIVVQLEAAGISSGNGVFSFDGSNDGLNWVTGISFRDGQGTAASTYVTSKTLSQNGNAAAFIPAGFRLMRGVVAVTTDGQYSAILEAGG